MDVPPHHGFADGRAVVHEVGAAVAGAWIVQARPVVVVRQFDQRIVFAQRDGLRGGRDAAHGAGEQSAAEAGPATGGRGAQGSPRRGDLDRGRSLRWREAPAATSAGCLIREGQRHFDLGVLGESFGAWQVDGAACAIELVRGAAGERVAGARAVADEEIGGIHQQAAARLGPHGETPENRLGERVLHRTPLGGIGARRAKRLVPLYQQHLGTDTLKRDELAAVFRPAVEAHVVRPQSGGDAGGQQEILVEARYLQPQIAGALLPIQREIAVQLAQTGGPLLDAG